MASRIRTVFLDRDGVINRTRPDYVKHWEEFELLPDAIESMASLARAGLEVIVLTNQSAIGRHLVTSDTVDAMHRRLADEVEVRGGFIRAFFVCPHTPDEGCSCRKPRPGLLFRAQQALGVDFAKSVMIGDQISDVEAATAAGCAAILIDDSGQLRQAAEALGATVVKSFRAAVDFVTAPSPVDEAIVLCGGLGTRLRGTLGERPKAMAIVEGRPFLEWLLLVLAGQGVRHAILAVGHGADVIRRHFRNGQVFGIELSFSFEVEALGTGGAARLAAQATRGSEVPVLNGDSYCRFDLAKMSRLHRATAAKATLWLQRVDRADRFGSVVTDRDGAVTAFLEKVAGAGMISAGVYLMDRDLLAQIPEGRSVSIEREIFPGLVGGGLYALAGDGPFVDIGTPESLAEAERLFSYETSYLEESIGRPLN
jgi:histidinol-phosphate phosphatase family protein